MHLEVDDLEAAGVEVIDDVRLPSAIAGEVGRLLDERATVERRRTELAATTRRTAAALRSLGLSTRDVGELLGISGTRVARIEREVASEPSRGIGGGTDRISAGASSVDRERRAG